jgi:mycobactin peptide synthetase MbtE
VSEGANGVSYLQEEWVRAIGKPTSSHNAAVGFEILGPLDRESLEEAFRALAERQDVLRTGLTEEHGAVLAAVQEAVDPRIQWLDLRDAAQADSDFGRVVAEALATEFVVAEAPMWRVVVARLNIDRHAVAVVLHHVIFDGWSGAVIMRSMAALYEAASGGGSRGPKRNVEFAEYAAWERAEGRESSRQYWRARLDERYRHRAVVGRDRREGLIWASRPLSAGSAAAGRALAEVGERSGVSVARVVTAAAAAMMWPWAGDEVIVGALLARRAVPSFKAVVGPLIDVLPVPVRLSGDPTFADVLNATSQAYARSREEWVPLGRIMSDLGAGPGESGAPLIDAVVNFVPAARSDGVVVAGKRGAVRFVLRSLDLDHCATALTREFSLCRHASYVVRWRPDGGYEGAIWGNATDLGWDGLRGISAAFGMTLRKLVADPSVRMSQLLEPA